MRTGKLLFAGVVVGLMCSIGGVSFAANGWTWRGEIFPELFSPKRYESGYWDYGEYQYFGGYMWWDRTRAELVRSLGQQNRIFYTHDLTDADNHLGYAGWYATNLPNAAFDTDNDQWYIPGDITEEETEVTVVDPSFPTPWPDRSEGYYFLIKMRRGGIFPWGNPPMDRRGGNVHHTPAVSVYAPTPDGDAWQTADYEREEFVQPYPPFTGALQSSTNEDIEGGNHHVPKASDRKVHSRIPLSTPMPIERFVSFAGKLSRPIVGFELRYETVSSISGEREILTIHGTSEGEEIISLSEAEQFFQFLPLSVHVVQLLGVSAFETPRTTP